MLCLAAAIHNFKWLEICQNVWFAKFSPHIYQCFKIENIFYY